MNKLKVVFFGTPEFAKESLREIHESKHEVVGVVTVADKASGRGQKINQSPVKIYAVEQGLPVFQPEKLRDEEFLAQIKNLEADIFVVVAFRMMPKVLFSMPRLGTFNLHASLLPDYRGAAPINYAVINGETKTGVTTFFINEKIDEGNILLQAETEILLEDNAYKIFKEDTKIDWSKEAETIYNFIRGMSPYPAAFTILRIGEEQKYLKIFGGIFEKKLHSKSVGEIEISKNNFQVFVKDGVYFPKEVQLEGKKRMNIQDFLNGFQNFENISLVK